MNIQKELNLFKQVKETYTYGNIVSRTVLKIDVVLRTIRNTELGSLVVVPQSILFPCLPSVFSKCGFVERKAVARVLRYRAWIFPALSCSAHFAGYLALYK